ncbi:MAG: hypothetical protein CVU56_22320 [Deltaproteobacteria bacterium HGW-Deltaproteobacteria-14]|nr:MAG: hypothetical protein CVU56_22320 [Deltaproteobacteria bacterium HGW-Deltaproteobacteria-14]
MLDAEITTYNQKLDDEFRKLEPPANHDTPVPPHPNQAKEKQMQRRGEAPRRDSLARVAGVDLTRIDGISTEAATTILDEVGPDLSRFPTEHHFVSLLKLCPRRAVSGGKQLSKRGRKGTGANRIAGILRMAAVSLGRSKSGLGANFRRVARHKDGGVAVFATARKRLLWLTPAPLRSALRRHRRGRLRQALPGAAAEGAPRHRPRARARARPALNYPCCGPSTGVVSGQLGGLEPGLYRPALPPCRGRAARNDCGGVPTRVLKNLVKL